MRKRHINTGPELFWQYAQNTWRFEAWFCMECFSVAHYAHAHAHTHTHTHTHHTHTHTQHARTHARHTPHARTHTHTHTHTLCEKDHGV